MYDNGIIILDETTSEEIVVEVGNTETSIMIDAPFAGAMGKASTSHYGIVKIGEGIKVVDGVIMVDTNYQGTVTSVNEIKPDDTGNVDTLVLSEPSEPKNKQIFIEITGSEEPIQLNMIDEDEFGTQSEEELFVKSSDEDEFGDSGDFETFDTGLSVNQNVFGH